MILMMISFSAFYFALVVGIYFFWIKRRENEMQNSHYRILFGTAAVEKGLITIEQLLRALNIQVMDTVEKREHRLTGNILVEEGYIAAEQIPAVIAAM